MLFASDSPLLGALWGQKHEPAPSGGKFLLASAAAAVTLLLLLRVTATGLAAAPQVQPVRLADGFGGAADLAAAQALLAAWPTDKPKACIMVLARNSDLKGVLSSVHQLERRFNRKHGYPYWWVLRGGWVGRCCAWRWPGGGAAGRMHRVQ